MIFLALLKTLLPDKEVSIAAPSSFWYLKQYPIEKIGKIVDYIVFMTYDLHGQWDAGNANSQVGCPNGRCLRSQVNVTETHNALAMITKAGVASNKIAAGLTSYGRSFNMADGDCYTEECFFTGTRMVSDATLGECTNEGGILANAEILKIIDDSSRVKHNFVDQDTHSNVLVYDDNQYVSWMSEDVKQERQVFYQALGIGGSVNWATDLEEYRSPPSGISSWLSMKSLVSAGLDPNTSGDRNGNWTELKCDNNAWVDWTNLSPEERWDQMDAPTAWSDLIEVWKDEEGGGSDFTDIIKANTGYPFAFGCGSFADGSGCTQEMECDSEDLGPRKGVAGIAIANALTKVKAVSIATGVLSRSWANMKKLYTTVEDAVTDSATLKINNALDSFGNDFAPVPPEPDNTWLLVLLDILTIGASAALGPLFKNGTFRPLSSWPQAPSN